MYIEPPARVAVAASELSPSSSKPGPAVRPATRPITQFMQLGLSGCSPPNPSTTSAPSFVVSSATEAPSVTIFAAMPLSARVMASTCVPSGSRPYAAVLI